MKKKFIVSLATGLLIFCVVGMAQASNIINANESSTTSGDDDTTATAYELGTLSAGDCFKINGWIDENEADDVDIYEFAISNTMSLFFDIDYANDIGNPNDNDTGVDTVLAIFNMNNELLSYNDDSDVFDGVGNDPGSVPNGDLDSLIGALELSAGSYYVAVSAYMNNPEAWDDVWSEGWESGLASLSTSGYLFDGMNMEGSTYSLSGGAETTGSYQLIISEDFDGAATVPVPATILLFSTGLAGLVGLRIERKNK